MDTHLGVSQNKLELNQAVENFSIFETKRSFNGNFLNKKTW